MNFSSLHPYVYLATRYPFAKGQSSSERICYMSSIYLVSEGYGTLITDGRTCSVGPGTLAYLPAGQIHEWIADPLEPMVHLCCYFDWQFVEREANFAWACPICYEPEQLQQALVGPAFPYPIPETAKVDSLSVWTDLFQNFYKSGEYINEQTFMRNLTIQRNFQTFMDYFLHNMLKDQPIPDRRIIQLLERMEQDLLHDTPKPLEVYYESLNLSRGHFFDIFRKSTGCSPIQYMNRFRLGRAKEDLLHTHLSITEISEKYHFSSVHYFSRLFHRQIGQTPREFRLR
ncbi:AraC family transcriptional regulator [Paenibacillus monticola]|uniref:Helix-turn-helix domain-containing protein n=1 Tax=Paenibacillus monticola TaxID=2666075 RepID=A0A7X2H9F0_9BACL|nr:helix-turn-helix domain-containing protein [Paenibacillus monticola]MRN55977.1 helix-turn-helix domain-containing protein [Paenibacillus monticola]